MTMTKIDTRLSQQNSGRRWRCRVYESASEMAADFVTCGLRDPGYGSEFMGESIHMAIANARGAGRPDLVSQAEKLLDKVTVALDIPHDAWERSVCGAYPVVAEFLAGVPNPMRRRVQVSSDRAPVKIVVDLTSGVVITADVLLRRGIACLALAMALSQERAVELWAFQATGADSLQPSTDDQHGTMWLVARSGEPLDLARAAGALASTGLIRGVGYQFNNHGIGRKVSGWAFGGSNAVINNGTNPDRYERIAREALGLKSTDVFIRPLSSYDPDADRPVEFVQKQLAAISARSEQGTEW